MSAPKICLHSVYLARGLLQDVLAYESDRIKGLEVHEKAVLRKMLRDVYDSIKEIGELTKN